MEISDINPVENKEKSGSVGKNLNRTDDCNKKTFGTQHHKTRPTTQQNSMQPNDKLKSYLRSRSPLNSLNSKRWRSTNAFINFMQDFRQNCVGSRNMNILQLGDEKWRRMSLDEKQPYIEVANKAKQLQKERNLNVKQQSVKSAPLVTPKTSNNSGQGNTKEERKNSHEKKRNRSETESDSDTGTSGTWESAISED